MNCDEPHQSNTASATTSVAFARRATERTTTAYPTTSEGAPDSQPAVPAVERIDVLNARTAHEPSVTITLTPKQ